MTTKEIRALCIEGTSSYYQYLEKNDRGLQRIPVLALQALPTTEGTPLYRLRLGSTLVDTEALVFWFKTNHTAYTNTAIPIVSYDKQQRILIIRPSSAYQVLFQGLSPKDLELIVDLKFLVQRVQTWYEKNGGAIALPQRRSPLHATLDQLSFFEDQYPSPSQQQALKTLFHAPLSYIWGAPGTGKTQGVLAYAVLHYLHQGRKVAILAPTNNALEQVLRGVIPMTDRAAIDRLQILRLGTPSKAYADAYPETCEARGILQQLKALQEQIRVLQSVLRYQNYHQLLALIETGEAPFVALQQAKANVDTCIQHERGLLVRLNSNQRKIERRQKQLQTIHHDIRSIERRIQLLEQAINRAFTSEVPQLKRDLKTLKSEYRTIEDEIDDYKADNELLQLDWEQAKQQLTEQQAVLEAEIVAVRQHLPITVAQELIDQLLAGQAQLVANHLAQLQQEYEQNKVKLGALAASYEGWSLPQLQAQLQTLQQDHAALQHYSTEERLKQVQVIATTLDGYIGRFLEEKLNVDHIFVDEAGYLNLVKILTLFNHRVPITLLGDHQQLPPVCEINDRTIIQDADYHTAFVWSQSAIFLEGAFAKTRNELLTDYARHAPLLLQHMQQANLYQTYRFGENLAAVLDAYVYQNGFEAVSSRGNTAIYYYHAPKPSPLPLKRTNPREVEVITDLLLQLDTPDFAILTPYRNQLQLLGKTYPQLRQRQQILTVHGSQGREWHTVILSIVDTHDKWFTDSQNRISKGLQLINTAVSRAKQRLILIGDIQYWSQQEGQLLQALTQIATNFEQRD